MLRCQEQFRGSYRDEGKKGDKVLEEVPNSVSEVREGFLEVVMSELRPKGETEPGEKVAGKRIVDRETACGGAES